jgi:hypothetical protein
VLERLLSLLAGGGAHAPAQLARQLGVSEGLLELMLADLTRMGYLRRVAGFACQALPDGPAPCAGCPLGGVCGVGGPGGQLWALTDKAFQRGRRSVKV